MPHRVGLGDAVTVLARDYPDGWMVGSHCHAAGQLIHAVSGVMEIRAGNQMWLVPPQRAVWMPPRQPHELRARGVVSLRTIYVRETLMPLGLDDHPGGRAMTPILRALILRTLDHEAYDASSDRRDRLHAVMLDELVCLPVDQVAITISTEPRLAQVCEMILADPASPLTLASLARDAGMSIRTLSRLARFELGCSMTVWRQQARIMAAVPMLVAGRSVIETGQATGYDTPSAFAAMFRRVVGTTPAAFAGRRTAIGHFKTL